MIDHCIQCRLWTGDVSNTASRGSMLESPNRALYEFMSHIPMCSVRPEPFYILILNTRPNATTTTTLGARNDTLLMGYAILQHLIQGYKSILYKVVFVEEDPLILQVWQTFWQDHASSSSSGVLQDDCVEVVTANPRSFLQNGPPSRQRYQVIFVTHDFHDDDKADPTTDDPWNMVHQSLVPGGVAACPLSLDPGSTKQAERQVSDPSWTIEYAQLPGSFLHPTSRLLRLHIRDSTNGTPPLPEVPATCRIPVRQPIRTDDAVTGRPEFYSPATHRTAFVLPPCLQDYQSQEAPERESEIPIARPTPIVTTEASQTEDNRGATTDSQSGHLACLEHQQIAATLSKLFRIPSDENALVPASSIEESDREHGPQHRLFTAAREQECFSIFKKPSCVIQ